MINISLNNRPEELAGELCVSDLLKVKNFTFKMLVIKINGVLIRKHEYDNTIIRNGDDVLVLHLISGG